MIQERRELRARREPRTPSELAEPSDHHRRLATFVGSWRGEELLHPSRALPGGGVTLGSFDYRMDVAGFFLLSSYQQRRGDPLALVLSGHGVYGWDPARGRYTMHWFDSQGGLAPQSPNHGTWDGDSLVFLRRSPRGFTRYIHTLEARDRYRFRMDGSHDGERWSPLMEGRYARKG